jgi:hypothetical protein
MGPDDAWGELEQRLAPLEALVPEHAPPWRAAALGAVAVLGVLGASVVALLGVVSIERLLVPAGDAADLTHGVALGIAMAAWGLLSLGVLAAASEAPSAVRKVPAVRHANLISSPVVPAGGAPSSTV